MIFFFFAVGFAFHFWASGLKSIQRNSFVVRNRIMIFVLPNSQPVKEAALNGHHRINDTPNAVGRKSSG